MRGGLDETLARLRRREEALRRRAAESTGATGDQFRSPEDQSGPPDPDRTDSRDLAPGWAGSRELNLEASQRHVLEDAAEALRAVVAAHPRTSVAARIEHDGQAYDLRAAWSDGEVTVTGQPAAPPPSWPMSANTGPGSPADPEGLEADPAARLAALIRRNPSLLTGEEPPG